MRNPFNPDPRERETQSIDRLLADAQRPTPACLRRYPPIYRRAVVLACAEPLAEIAAVLRDPERVVERALIERVGAFLRDGCTSPLLRDHTGRARLAASALAAAVASAPWRPSRVAAYPVIAVPRAG